MEKHKIGICSEINGSVTVGYKCLDTPAVIIDKPENEDDYVTFHKVGSVGNIREIYDDMCKKFNAAGFKDMADSLMMFTFNVKSSWSQCTDKHTIFSADEVCTIINWLQNSISVGDLNKFLALNEDGMHKRVAELASYGF